MRRGGVPGQRVRGLCVCGAPVELEGAASPELGDEPLGKARGGGVQRQPRGNLPEQRARREAASQRTQRQARLGRDGGSERAAGSSVAKGEMLVMKALQQRQYDG